MEKITIFLDFANIEASAPFRINYGALRRYLGEGRNVLESFAYVPIDPRMPQARDGLIRHLQQGGWMVNAKMGKIAGQTYKANVDVEMTMDIIQCAEHIRPDIIVLCSGDGDFMPLIRFMRHRGVRLETAAFRRAASHEVKTESSGFIDLDLWCREASLSVPPFRAQAPFIPAPSSHRRDPRFSEEEAAFLRRAR